MIGLNMVVVYCWCEKDRGSIRGKRRKEAEMEHEVGKGSYGCMRSMSHFCGIFKALVVLNR